MEIDKKLDLLKKIKQVDAPPFFLARIMKHIDFKINQPAPVAWRLAFATAAIIVITLNVSIFFKSLNKQQNEQGIEVVLSSMELLTSNELYHD